MTWDPDIASFVFAAVALAGFVVIGQYVMLRYRVPISTQRHIYFWVGVLALIFVTLLFFTGSLTHQGDGAALSSIELGTLEREDATPTPTPQEAGRDIQDESVRALDDFRDEFLEDKENDK